VRRSGSRRAGCESAVADRSERRPTRGLGRVRLRGGVAGGCGAFVAGVGLCAVAVVESAGVGKGWRASRFVFGRCCVGHASTRGGDGIRRLPATSYRSALHRPANVERRFCGRHWMGAILKNVRNRETALDSISVHKYTIRIRRHAGRFGNHPRGRRNLCCFIPSEIANHLCTSGQSSQLSPCHRSFAKQRHKIGN
jgi:hypothetical protein